MNHEIVIRVGLLMAALISARPVAQGPSVTSKLQEVPEKITVCQLKSDPAKYNHKLVEVTGFISHGFEDFGLFDPECESKNSIWLDYGGKKASNTMYCCGVTPSHTRPDQALVDNISIPLVDDERFKQLDKLIRSEYDLVMHGTIVGRFFSGEQVSYPGGVFWSGYGHMGCCMLLMIQQVVSVDPHDRRDLDYGASFDQPDISKVGCGYTFLMEDERFSEAIARQRKAESGNRAWAFDDPRRVAIEGLAASLRINETSISGVTQKRQRQGRAVYEWKPKKSHSKYMVVVSRPYWLSFYARDPNKVPWVAVAAYRIGCGEENSVTEIR